jgi:hypothetical protein
VTFEVTEAIILKPRFSLDQEIWLTFSIQAVIKHYFRETGTDLIIARRLVLEFNKSVPVSSSRFLHGQRSGIIDTKDTQEDWSVDP